MFHRLPALMSSLLLVALGVLLLTPDAPAAMAQGKPLAIDGNVALVESPQEAGPIHHATEDLAGDFTKIFGRAPKLVSSLSEAGPIAILIAQRDNLPAGHRTLHVFLAGRDYALRCLAGSL